MAVASGPVGPVLAGPIFSPCSHTHLSCCVEHTRRFKDLQLLRSPSSPLFTWEHIHGVACGPVGLFFSGPICSPPSHTHFSCCVCREHAR